MSATVKSSESHHRGAAKVREAVRARIVSGDLPPEAMLPSHVELAKLYGVSNVTVQQGLSQLADQGFLSVRHRVGSFVHAHPPHLTAYAVVFPFDPDNRHEGAAWSKYYQSLSLAVVEVQRQMNRRVISFHGIDHHGDNDERRRLFEAIERQQLAGLIFASSPHALAGTPIVDALDMPRVELSSPHTSRWPVIALDDRWLDQALAHLVARGRRRVAILLNRFNRDKYFSRPACERLFAAHGIDCPVHWRQAAEWRDPEAASHCVQLLFHAPPDERPNALLIMDDNLIEGVVAGLLAARLRPSADVEVVAHANYPLPTVPALPFKLLGYDLRQALHLAINLIDEQRRGRATSEIRTLPAIWQEAVA